MGGEEGEVWWLKQRRSLSLVEVEVSSSTVPSVVQVKFNVERNCWAKTEAKTYLGTEY
jgi:hypothetical protein